MIIPDLDKMSRELQVSRSTLEKYLRAFTGIGILKAFKRIRKGGKTVYAIGMKRGYRNSKDEGGGVRKLYYLKESREILEKLAAFRLNR